MKKKLLKANQVHYMTKALRKAIMRRSELDSKYYKLKTNDTLKVYNKQKHYLYSRLYKKESENLFENLNFPFVTDNKTFWKVVKPFSNRKGSGVDNEVILSEKDKVLIDRNEVPKDLSSYCKLFMDHRKLIYN